MVPTEGKGISSRLGGVRVVATPAAAVPISNLVLDRVGDLFQRGFEVLVPLFVLGNAFGECAEHRRSLAFEADGEILEIARHHERRAIRADAFGGSTRIDPWHRTQYCK